LSNTERHGWVPHIFALAAMARIYKRRLTTVLQWYGVVLGPLKPAPVQFETPGNRPQGALNPVFLIDTGGSAAMRSSVR
jgi:hypothetical protein